MTRTRQIVLSITVVALVAAAFGVFWKPSPHKGELVIAPSSGPAR